MRTTPGPRHLFIPDTQIKPGLDLSHLEWAGRYAAVKRPDVIVIAGDWYDMPSLSSYDKGKLAAEGRRYDDDIAAGTRGLELFERAMRRHAPRGYSPRKIVTLGNHEDRITRSVQATPELAGKLSLDDLAFARFDWEVRPFLEPVTIDRITYAHFFPIGPSGRVTNNKNGAPSALAQVRRMMCSCVAGHRQGLDQALISTPGAMYRGIIAGSFYQHAEIYLTPMGDRYWRGLLVFNDVRPTSGEFDLCEVSLSYLERRFG